MERESRYWFVELAGKRENILLKRGMQQLWDWAKSAQFIRLFTDGEYRYSNEGDWGKIPPVTLPQLSVAFGSCVSQTP
jgi:hypothetical protein